MLIVDTDCSAGGTALSDSVEHFRAGKPLRHTNVGEIHTAATGFILKRAESDGERGPDEQPVSQVD
jgi:hypothetical protein